MKSFSRINLLALLLLAFAVLLPLAAVTWFVVQKHNGAQSKLDEIEPKYARLLGLQASAAQLDASIDQAIALFALHAYPATQDASQVGNAAQQRLREMFSGAGMEVVSSQILPSKPAPGQPFEKIALSLRVEGQLVGFQSSMVALATLKPTVWVEGYTAQTMGNVTMNVPPRLTVLLNLYVVRAK